MDGCVFCQIVAAAAPASIVHADERSVAFMDIAPINPGHLLVIPRLHATSLADLDEETAMHLFRVAQRATGAIRRSGVRCEGVNLFLADGEAAGQEVFHLHLHVIPRFTGDNFRLDAVWAVRPPREALDRMAADIGRAYAEPRAGRPDRGAK
jgi:diadenosine tetraphosphate (Ap4A) HIT family hydrolase